MGEVEPGGALVVEVGEGPLFAFLGALFFFKDETRITDGADFGVVGAFLAVRREGVGNLWRPRFFTRTITFAKNSRPPDVVPGLAPQSLPQNSKQNDFFKELQRRGNCLSIYERHLRVWSEAINCSRTRNFP